MSRINQNQIRNLKTTTIADAALVGRPNEITHILELNNMFQFTIDGTLVDNGTSILPANGVNGHWVRISDSVNSNFSAVSDPVATDDASLKYEVGSIWVNTLTDKAFICLDATPSLAVWHQIDTTSSGSLNNFTATSDPNSTHGSSVGYAIGSHWVNTSTNGGILGVVPQKVFVCVDATVGAATWTNVSSHPITIATIGRMPTPADDYANGGYLPGALWIDIIKDKSYILINASVSGVAIWKEITTVVHSATANPTAASDLSNQYYIGEVWVNTATKSSYICIDNTNGAAIWNPVSTVDGVKVNMNAPTFPSSTDDLSLGYQIGSSWYVPSTLQLFICRSASVGGALWTDAITGVKNNNLALSAPTVNDDSSANYEVGSIWNDRGSFKSWVCMGASVGSAIWFELAFAPTVPAPNNNFLATVNPVATNDATQNYSVGSLWINLTADTSFICVNSLAGASIWHQIDSTGGVSLLNNYAGATSPPVSASTAAGYSVGSIWVDTVASMSFICVDSTAGLPIWNKIGSITRERGAVMGSQTQTVTGLVSFSPLTFNSVPFTRGGLVLDTATGHVSGIRAGSMYQLNFSISPINLTSWSRYELFDTFTNGSISQPVVAYAPGAGNAATNSTVSFIYLALSTHDIAVRTTGGNHDYTKGSTFSVIELDNNISA